MKNRTIRTAAIIVGIAVVIGVTLLIRTKLTPVHSKTVSETAERKISVQVIKPVIQDLDIKLRYPVNIQAIYQANILPTALSGYLTEVNVDKGDYVEKGQRLASIDPTEEEEKVKQVEEACRQAEASYKNTELTLKRYQEMRKKDFISQQDVDNAELSFEVAKTNWERAKADLRAHKVHLEYSTLEAPFSGYITMRYLDPGSMVTPTSTPPILTLMKIDELRVQVNVVEQDIHYIRLHQKAEFSVDSFPGWVFQGEVSRFAHAVDPLSRTLLVEIDIHNSDLDLKPGMYGCLNLIVDKHPKSILLPAEAILSQESGSSVFTVEDGRVKRVSITTGYDDGNFLEVTQGLTGNESVILSGQDLVTDGTMVEETLVTPHLQADHL
ncbi:MAG: efflux RND transporter periplasmic adaptor subunit [Planctomycetota bacterium]|nr:efflux RND transporter periplasmic adaptor subunit [Planctomycetota bacterium]MDE2215878.1 efflux RND transporter periplasmic adaptor subunit [Planctomycetota bacterium]